jgi:hypothetical protein
MNIDAQLISLRQQIREKIANGPPSHRPQGSSALEALPEGMQAMHIQE